MFFLKIIQIFSFKIYNLTPDPDPNSMYLDPQHWSKVPYLHCRRITWPTLFPARGHLPGGVWAANNFKTMSSASDILI